MLHDGDHGIAEFAELVGLAAVTPSVVCNLLTPPLTVPLRFDVAPWAPVPETTVNEDGDAVIREEEVGPSRQISGSRRMTDTHLSHNRPDPSLRLCSLRCDATHPLRYLRCRPERAQTSRHADKRRCRGQPPACTYLYGTGGFVNDPVQTHLGLRVAEARLPRLRIRVALGPRCRSIWPVVSWEGDHLVIRRDSCSGTLALGQPLWG